MIEPCAVLLLAGDLVPCEIERNKTACDTWFSTVFAEWLEQVPATEVFGCAGNHDFALMQFGPGVHERPFGARWTYVQDTEFRTHDGLTGYATPWTSGPPGVWAFQDTDTQLRKAFSAIPSGLDILMGHCPPKGRGDYVRMPAEKPGLGPTGYHAGSRELLRVIRERKPRLVVFGHMHSHGGYRSEQGETRFANVSILGPEDQIVREPAKFELSFTESHDQS